MKPLPRIYDSMLKEHLALHRQMAFVTGPRQVGKTTTCRSHADHTLNWDNLDDRELILGKTAALAEVLHLNQLQEQPPVVLLDELHKYPRWKQFLKGMFDTFADRLRLMVTGSSRLDVYRRIGDSLMGRYFLYHMHPFSVAETGTQELPDPIQIVRPPHKPKPSDWHALWTHGGYPEPFLKRDPRFTRRWQSLRMTQLMREDVRDQTQIQQVDQLGTLVKILASRSGQQLIYSHLASEIRVSVDTMRRWIITLCNLHQGFLVKPWFKNVSRSLRKEPKWYLRDWSGIEEPGNRCETFIACHLLKAVDGWNDLGLGKFDLGYLRDKNQREVDFIVIRDGQPWFLVEVKRSQTAIGDQLGYFQQQTSAPFAFQVVLEADYVEADCFGKTGQPISVPGQTFLSQLL